MSNKYTITELPILTPLTGELPEFVLAPLSDGQCKIRVADIQNRVAIEEMQTLKEILEWCCDKNKARYAETGDDWFNGRYFAYNTAIGYLQKRIDSLEKMA